MKKKSYFEKIVEATGKNFAINQSVSGYYRLMLDGEPVIDDSACEDINEDYDTAEGYFSNYLLEYEVPEDKKEMRCGAWFLKDEKKKYTVYYNDEVNEIADVFSADTLEECKEWINEQLVGKTLVDAQYDENVVNTSKTFIYEVYDRPIIEIINDEEIFNEAVYMTDYYYTD